MDNNAFHKLSYGLFVIGSVKDGKLNGQIANTVFQISSDPATWRLALTKRISQN